MHNQRQTQGHNHNRKRNIMEEAQSFLCRHIWVLPVEEGKGPCECFRMLPQNLLGGGGECVGVDSESVNTLLEVQRYSVHIV